MDARQFFQHDPREVLQVLLDYREHKASEFSGWGEGDVPIALQQEIDLLHRLIFICSVPNGAETRIDGYTSQDIIQTARAENSRLCHGDKWNMHIPVNEEEDSDRIFGRLADLAAQLHKKETHPTRNITALYAKEPKMLLELELDHELGYVCTFLMDDTDTAYGTGHDQDFIAAIEKAAGVALESLAEKPEE